MHQKTHISSSKTNPKTKTPTRAVTRIDFRTTEEIKALIERAAQMRNKTLTAYLLDVLVPQAKEDIRQVQTISLTESERDVFFSALIDPPKPNAALRALFSGKKQSRAR
jgi:uncharacterized protein (DUF1778 family)